MKVNVNWTVVGILSLSLLPVLVWGVKAQYDLQSALTETIPCGTPEIEMKLRGIIHEALEDAFREHVKNTFAVWMKDDREQPARAARGVRGGANAYLQSLRAMEKWHLMTCPDNREP